MATSVRINRNARHDLGVIGVRLLDEAHMTWVAAEVESKHARRARLKRAASRRALVYLGYRAAVDREEAPRDLQRLSDRRSPA